MFLPLKSLVLLLYFSFKIFTEYASHEIRLRITNSDIYEMVMNEGRRAELIQIFEQKLWPEAAGKLYVTHLADPEDEGFLLPLDPNDYMGYVFFCGTHEL